jgi:hypothetical protein
MRSTVVCLFIIAIAILLVARPIAAQGTVMQIPFISAGPAWFLGPSEIGELVVIETNISHLAASDAEAFAVSFTPAETMVPGRFTISPVIGQTSSRTIACDRSYFYQDFLVATA